MIEEQGSVVTIDDDAVWVETERKTTCSSCSARHGCGQHLSEKYKPKNSHAYIKAACSLSLNEGDKVVIGIPETALMKASLLVYMLPLFTMMSGMWLASTLGLSDPGVLLITVASLLLGFFPVRKLGQQTGDMCRVKVIKVLSVDEQEPDILAIR